MTSEFNQPDNVGRQPRGEEPNEQRQLPETPQEHGGDRYRHYARQFSQWCWDRRPDATQSLAFGTWALALVAFIAMLDGRWALEQSQRAWIAPLAASQNPQHSLSRDTPFLFVINYSNTGREPAIDVNVSTGQAFTTPPPTRWREGEWSDFQTGDNNTCDGQRPIPNGPIIYPTNMFTSYTLYRSVNDTARVNAIMNGDVVLVYRGCFVYITMKAMHRSAYCFYLKPIPEVPPATWLFNNCEDGSHAD